MASNPKSTLTVTQARRYLEASLGVRLSRSTAYRLVADGRIDAHRLGSRILIPEKALWEFLERCQRGERY